MGSQFLTPAVHVINDFLKFRLAMRQQPRLRQFINPTWDKRHFGHSFFSNNALDQHRVSLIRLLIVPSAGFMLGVAVLGTPKRAEGACRRLQMMRRLLSEISQAKE